MTLASAATTREKLIRATELHNKLIRRNLASGETDLNTRFAC